MGLEAPRATGGVRTRGGRSQGLQCSMGDTIREIGRGRGWRLPLLRRMGGGENRRDGRSQGLQCSMGDTSRKIGRGRGWCFLPLRCSGGGENRRGGRSQGLQCSRVLYGSGDPRARPAKVYCKGAGATAEYCTGAEECVEGSTAPVRRRGLSYRGEARGIRPWVETQVCKVTINCGYRCGRDRVSHLLKFRGRVISAIRYSVGACVYFL